MQIKEPERFHHLVPHQWHRSIEDLHVRHDVLDVRCSVPLDPQLRPLRLQQQVGPLSAGLLEDVKEHRFGRRNCRPERGRVVHLAFLLPGPGCSLAPWGGMVRRFCQGHLDAHPCIPQVSMEASLPPPPGGTSVCSSISRPRKVHQHNRSQTGKATLEVRTCVVVVVVEWL